MAITLTITLPEGWTAEYAEKVAEHVRAGNWGYDPARLGDLLVRATREAQK